jgi:hypothetical protein
VIVPQLGENGRNPRTDVLFGQDRRHVLPARARPRSLNHIVLTLCHHLSGDEPSACAYSPHPGLYTRPCTPILTCCLFLRHSPFSSHVDLLRVYAGQSVDLLRLSGLSTSDDPLNRLLNPPVHPARPLFVHTSINCILDLLRNPSQSTN